MLLSNVHICSQGARVAERAKAPPLTTELSLLQTRLNTVLPQSRDIQRGNTRQIMSRRYIQSINYRKLYSLFY
jgi:hypothetical protein